MIYIFEDDEKDLLSQLYREAYPEDVRKNFVYAQGNGWLEKYVLNYIRHSDVAVFIDMVPDNDNCREIYLDLVKIAKDENIKNRLFIFPIVCSEYYMIKSLFKYTNYIDKDQDDVLKCLNKGDYRNSRVYIHNGKKCKNFEHYCKVIIRRYVLDCIKHTTRFDDGTLNQKYGLYYNSSCLCNNSGSGCKTKSLVEKAVELLRVYDYVPDGSLASDKASIDNDEIVRIHRELVDDYNKMLDEYLANGIVMESKKKNKRLVYAM